jgi:hypothetical protein
MLNDPEAPQYLPFTSDSFSKAFHNLLSLEKLCSVELYEFIKTFLQIT